MLSQSVENFVKTVYRLQKPDEWVGTSRLAKALGQRPASVTNMAQKLAKSEDGLITYQAYKGVKLTETGTSVALEVIRHHRLIELYLSKQLGVPWDKVHDEAEKLEHAISEKFEDRIAKALGNPEIDPHGHLIPRKDGTMPERSDCSLLKVEVGATTKVSKVSDRDPEMLRYLSDIGIKPGVDVELVERGPFDGPLMLRVDGAKKILALGTRVAAEIHVIADSATGA